MDIHIISQYFDLHFFLFPCYLLQVKYVDIVCYNRYYAWYSDSGYLDLISYQLDREMQLWHNMTGKLLLMTEYGGDAVAGLYQVKYGLFLWSGSAVV